MEKFTEINTFLHLRSDVGFKGTVVNRALLSLHGFSLKITITAPFRNSLFDNSIENSFFVFTWHVLESWRLNPP